MPLPPRLTEINRSLELAAMTGAGSHITGSHVTASSAGAASKSLRRETIRSIATERRNLRTDLGRLESALKESVQTGVGWATENQHRLVALEECLARESELRLQIETLRRRTDRQSLDIDHAIESVQQEWAFAQSMTDQESRKTRTTVLQLSARLKALADQLGQVRGERSQLLRLLRDERTRRRQDREALVRKHERDQRMLAEKNVEQSEMIKNSSLEYAIEKRRGEILINEIHQLHGHLYSADRFNDALKASLTESHGGYWQTIEQIVQSSRRQRMTRCMQHQNDIQASAAALPSLRNDLQTDIYRRHWRLVERMTQVSRRSRMARCMNQDGDLAIVQSKADELAPQTESVVADSIYQRHWQTVQRAAQTSRRSRMERCRRQRSQTSEQIESTLNDFHAARSIAATHDASYNRPSGIRPFGNPIATNYRRFISNQIEQRNHASLALSLAYRNQLAQTARENPNVQGLVVPVDSSVYMDRDARNAELNQVSAIDAVGVYLFDSMIDSPQPPSDQTEGPFALVSQLEAQVIASVDAAAKLRIDLNHRMTELQVMQTEQQHLRDRLQRRNRQLARRHDRQQRWIKQHGEQIDDLTGRVDQLSQELATNDDAHQTKLANAEAEIERHRQTALKQHSELVRFERHVEMLRELIRQGRGKATLKMAQYEQEISAYALEITAYEQEISRLRGNGRRAA